MRALDIFIAQYLIFFSILATFYFFLRLPKKHKKRFLIEALIGGVIAFILAKIGSQLFNDPRPFITDHVAPYFAHANDNGFPSDHTLLSSFLGFLVLRYNKKWGYALLLAAAAIGLARVFAGVHHIADIIGSFAFAGLGVAAAYFIATWLLKNKK